MESEVPHISMTPKDDKLQISAQEKSTLLPIWSRIRLYKRFVVACTLLTIFSFLSAVFFFLF